MKVFFNSDGGLEEVSRSVFETIGLSHYLEGDSQNSLGGSYSSYSVFGINIRLELNSYDYEDDYKFMLLVRRDMNSRLKCDAGVEDEIATLVLKLLYNNLHIPLVIEKANMLQMVSFENENR